MSVLGLWWLLLLSIVGNSHESKRVHSVSKGSTDKVEVNLYYETLCPFCQRLIVNNLPQLFRSDLSTIAELNLVPWGNAYTNSYGNIICQHGRQECYLNAIHACVIHLWPQSKQHFAFIYCVEASLNTQSANPGVWEGCARGLGFSAVSIQHCYTSGQGRQLLLRNQRDTLSLNPPKRFVPWLVVNGFPLAEDYLNFVKYICRASGGKKPSSCYNFPRFLNADTLRPQICSKNDSSV